MLYNLLHNKQKEWLTIKEVSNITGKSTDSLRMLLHRKKLTNVKKANNGNNGTKRSQWLIHKDNISLLHNSYVTGDGTNVTCDKSITSERNSNIITLEYHDSKQQEWLKERDQLKAGIIMYQYKFEELDRQLKLLPAPAEVVKSRLIELEHSLQEEKETKQKLINDLEAELQKERSLTWWQKLWAK